MKPQKPFGMPSKLEILVPIESKMKESDTIDDFIRKLSEISTKAASLGENIEETKIVKKFLKNLPRKKYIHIIAALEQVLDLKTTTLKIL